MQPRGSLDGEVESLSVAKGLRVPDCSERQGADSGAPSSTQSWLGP